MCQQGGKSLCWLSRCRIVSLVQKAIGGNMSEGFIRDWWGKVKSQSAFADRNSRQWLCRLVCPSTFSRTDVLFRPLQGLYSLFLDLWWTHFLNRITIFNVSNIPLLEYINIGLPTNQMAVISDSRVLSSPAGARRTLAFVWSESLKGRWNTGHIEQRTLAIGFVDPAIGCMTY